MSLFDFTNTSDKGYAVLPPGEYQIRTGEWWLRKKEDTGNLVIDMDTEIIAGAYKGETPRYFHSITTQEFSKGYLLRMLKALGIIVDGDRGDKGELMAEFVYGDQDENGRVQILSVEVNGEAREVEGLRAGAVVTPRNDKVTGERITSISKLVEPKEVKETASIPKEPGTVPEKAKAKAPVKKAAGKAKGLPF